MRKILIMVLSLVLCLGVNEIKLNSKEPFNYEYYYQDGVYEESKLIDKNTILELNLIIDDGKISYLDLDRTIKSDLFKISEDNIIYYYVEGLEDKVASSYRYLVDLNDYRSLKLDFDSRQISTDDLIVGLDSEKISSLSTYDTYLYQSVIDKDYREDVINLTNFVKEKNSINGLTLDEDLKITNFKTNYDLTEEVVMIKEVLNSLKKDNSTKVVDYAKTKSNTYGIYEPGNYTKVVPNFNSHGMYLNVIKYYVNENGKLTYFALDEIVNDKGIFKTRSSIDSEFKEEASLLSKKILTNQSINSLKLVNNEKILDLKEDKISDYDFLSFNNLDFKENAKYLYLGINASLIDSVRELKLVDGVHYTSVDNMMMSLVVKDSKLVDMTIDETFKWENAKVMIYDPKQETYKAYLLYLFDDAEKKDNVDPDDNDPFNEDGEANFYVTKKVIYGDGTYFFYPNGMPVSFDKTYIDEEATLITAYGNLTKQNSLIYDNINGVNYHDDIEKLIEFFLETKNPYSLNILEDGTTDTLDIDIEVANYQNLFSSSLFEASSTDNIFNKENSLIVDEEFSVNVEDGRYYGIGSFASTDEGFYTLTLTIKDNKVESIILDETYDNYGVLTTKNNLKNDYYFIQELENGVRKDFTSYYEVSKDLSNYLYQNNIIEKLFNDAVSKGYDFSKEAIPYKIDPSILISGLMTKPAEANYLLNFASAIENIINDLLVNVHTSHINKIDEILTEVSEEKVLVSSKKLDEAYIDLTPYLTIKEDSENTKYSEIELRVRSNDNTLRAKMVDGKLIFSYDDELERMEVGTLEVRYSYDKYKDITKVYNFRIVPEKLYLKMVLDSDELHFNGDSTKVNLESNLNFKKEDSTIYTNLESLLEKNTISYLDKEENEVDNFLEVFNANINSNSSINHDFNESNKVEIFFDLDDDQVKTKKDLSKEFEFETYDSKRIKKETKDYVPALLDNRIVNGTYDLSLGLDRLVKVNGLEFSLTVDGPARISGNKLIVLNESDQNKLLNLKLVNKNDEEEVYQEYSYVVIPKTSEEKLEEVFSEELDLDTYIFIDEENEVAILGLDNSEDLTWYYEGRKVLDGKLDLSDKTFPPNSLTNLTLSYVYDDGMLSKTKDIDFTIVNEFAYQVN